jgi:NodT family efflux transporter outer membrane factor (OMF) lipoprotein
MNTSLFKYSLLIVLVLFLSACTLGPQFSTPKAPEVSSYTSLKSSSVPGDQKFVNDQDIPEKWWMSFKCSKLDEMIEIALKNNHSLAAAKETLHQVREEWNAQRAQNRFPKVWGSAQIADQRISNVNIDTKAVNALRFTTEDLLLNFSYDLDIYGQNKKELEALLAKMDYQKFQLEGVTLNLIVGIIGSVGKEMALREKIKITQDILVTQEQQLSMFEKQMSLGGASRLNVLSQKTLLEQTKAILPPLQKQLAYTRHQLAVYLGKFPNEEKTLPEFRFEEITLPLELPMSLPSRLTQQRPDIRAAEELLHMASANIGVAHADLFPHLTLSGGYGTQANYVRDLFKPEHMIGNLAAGLTQPLFDGGHLKAKYRASWNAYNQALAEYQDTVLSAFQNVADVLRAIETDTDLIKAQMNAFSSAQETFSVAQKQYESGAASYLDVLNAQQQFQEVRMGVVDAYSTRFSDTTGLFKALGGGWWNRKGESL